jgi:hypothetical protein
MGSVGNVIEWLHEGVEQGYCSPTYCTTHDSVPVTSEEDEEFIDGGDPCIHAVRLYEE